MSDSLHRECGMPYSIHNVRGNMWVCPDHPGWVPPYEPEEDEPDPPVAALFDSYEEEDIKKNP
jgi:hypothetical protein